MSNLLKLEVQPLRWLIVVAVGVTVVMLSILFAKVLSVDGSIALPHANSDESPLPQIVYEIYVIYPNGIMDILKYGISSQLDFVTKDGNPRPEYQIPAIKCQSRFVNCTIWYNILHKNVPGRLAAKAIEQELVNAYRLANGRNPLLQKRPIPNIDKIK